MATRNYFNLDAGAPLFKELEKRPEWWNTVCEDNELYINIRKDNRVNVYYKGASVMDMSYTKGKVAARIASKYLDADWNCETAYCRTAPKKIIDDLDRIKLNINRHYGSKKDKPEGISEKEIQGTLYLNGKYIDTEYAYVYPFPSRLIIRVDLTTIREDGLIEFVELKRISDARLLHVEGSEKEPEILRQMRDYNGFITEKQSDIVSYYKKVQTIMKNTGIHNPLLDCDIKGVAPHVRLLFAPYTDGKTAHPKRRNRVERIAGLLEREGVISNIGKI